jgi:NAD(P)H-flavin reductase
MLIWFGKWAVEGNLWHNMTTIDDLRISTPNFTWSWNVTQQLSSCSGVEPHWDNFTIVINWVAWLGLTAMVGLAVKCRRSNYELFHYVHHFAWLYYLIAAMHAWGFWQYACGGLALYLVDRCVRLSRGATCNAVVSLDLVDGVSIVRLPSELLRHVAGQYAFVNIPAVSELQWHPFTISSAPSAPEVSFHIKDMGEGTWTGQLAALARTQVMTEVRVDGPYGRLGAFSDKRALVLVAGGIGITPLHSVFAEVYEVAARVKSAQCGSIEHVVLLWAGRSDSTFCLFAPTFHKVSQRNPNGAFEFYLFNSAPVGGAGAGGPPGPSGGDVKGHHAPHDEVYMGDIPHDALVYTKSVIQRGRPPVAEKMSEVAQRFHPDDVMVMACGPEALILSASSLAFQHGFHFHTEVFHF